MPHILVVDDDSMYTTMLRIILEGEGYTVTMIESAVRALESLDFDEYDLILLDVVMPDMDGLELCRRIRATSRVPILFVTVRSDGADRVLGLRAGADDYLAKPFDPDELLARIRAHDTSPVVDQAALHGLLRKVRDLGLPLLGNQRQAQPGRCVRGH